MNILLTNDDGYGAEGLEVLKVRLRKDGHNVYVMAPSGNRSGVSHGMSFCSLSFKKINEYEWTCSGKPADCVVTALRSGIFKDVKFDCVISGINAGGNIGTDILYSGTAAGARQAVMYRIPGIALSIQPVGNSQYLDSDYAEKDRFYYSPMADFAAKNLESLMNMCRTDIPYAFVNVNSLSVPEYKGAAVCNSLSVRTYDDWIELAGQNEKGEYTSRFYGAEPVSQNSEGSDFAVMASGRVSVSAVYAEPVACTVDGICFSL